jgi:hypothetical protein
MALYAENMSDEAVMNFPDIGLLFRYINACFCFACFVYVITQHGNCRTKENY